MDIVLFVFAILIVALNLSNKVIATVRVDSGYEDFVTFGEEVPMNCTVTPSPDDIKWLVNDNGISQSCDILDEYKQYVNTVECSRNQGVFNIMINSFDMNADKTVWNCTHESFSDSHVFDDTNVCSNSSVIEPVNKIIAYSEAGDTAFLQIEVECVFPKPQVHCLADGNPDVDMGDLEELDTSCDHPLLRSYISKTNVIPSKAEEFNCTVSCSEHVDFVFQTWIFTSTFLEPETMDCSEPECYGTVIVVVGIAVVVLVYFILFLCKCVDNFCNWLRREQMDTGEMVIKCKCCCNDEQPEVDNKKGTETMSYNPHARDNNYDAA